MGTAGEEGFAESLWLAPYEVGLSSIKRASSGAGFKSRRDSDEPSEHNALLDPAHAHPTEEVAL